MHTNRNLQATKRKLERLELEHLRRHALELHEQIEQLQNELEWTRDSANFWHDAINMQEAMLDENFATHRCVGINRSGELMVVQMGSDHV